MFSKLLTLIGFLSLSSTLIAQDRTKLVEVITAEPVGITKKVKLIGTIKAKQESHLYSKIPGIVEQIYTQAGMPVKEGELLVTLENENLEKVYKLSIANEDLARKHYERSKGLEGKGYLSTRGLEELERDWIMAQIATEEAKQSLEQTLIKAPFDGYCGSFKVTQGAAVKKRDEIVTVYDPSELMVEFGIPENLIFKIRPEQEVYADHNKGVITSVQQAIDPTTRMGLARAKLEANGVVVGMTVDVEVVTDQRDNVLGLPTEAIFLEDSTPHVYRVVEGKAILTPITIGLQGNNFVEVTEGLNTGDIIIIRGHFMLYNECPVKIYDKQG